MAWIRGLLKHNHFKQSWNMLHDAASTGRRPKNMTLKQFLDTGLSFVRGLTMHHDIEETYLYPMLAPKMSEFRHAQGGGGSKKLSQKQSELIQQHRDIHDGMYGAVFQRQRPPADLMCVRVCACQC